MLRFKFSETDKDELKQKIINEFSKVGINVEPERYRGDFYVLEEESGLSLNGMKYCTIEAGPPFSMIEFEDAVPGDAIRAIKKAYPEVEIKGSLLLGDDNYRRNYWYGSEAGSTEVEEDYAIVEDEDHDMGIPVSDCWFASEFGTDYGIEHCAFCKSSDFVEMLEEYCEGEPIGLEDLVECMQDDGYLPENITEAKKIVKKIVNQFVDEIEDYDDELSEEVLKSLKRICSNKDSKELLQSLIDEL